MKSISVWKDLDEDKGEVDFTEPAICESCGMKERVEWVLEGNHECGIITDPKIPAEYCKGMTLRIGKYRFVKIA